LSLEPKVIKTERCPGCPVYAGHDSRPLETAGVVVGSVYTRCPVCNGAGVIAVVES